MLEQMLQEQAAGVDTNEYIMQNLENNIYKLTGVGATRISDDLKNRLRGYGQKFEDITRLILNMDPDVDRDWETYKYYFLNFA